MQHPLNRIHRSGRVLPLLALLVLILSAVLQSSAGAQTGSQIKISSPDTSRYPTVSFSFWPFDEEGNFVNNITPATLNVFENDQQVRIDSLQLLEPGTHFVLAVNEGKTLGNSYAGKARLEYMREAWIAWANDQSITTMDDFTLINNEGTVNDQLGTPAEWVDALEGYQPVLPTAAASLNCLSLAIDKLSNLVDNKTRTILLITPLPDANQLTLLDDAASRAKAADIHIFVWLVGPQTYETEATADTLRQMAEDTGGSFFLFSGAETLPEIETYLKPLRFEYTVSYTTLAQESGTYSLEVQVDQSDFQERSSKARFSLTVAAPNPIILSPPSNIIRTWTQDEKTGKWSLGPSVQTIDFMLEFPDGHIRSLKSAQLYVDGELVAENTAEPFNEFKWDLSKYAQTGNHKLQIRIEDVAGLTAATVETPITVTVEQKPLNFIQRLIDNIGWQTLGISLFLILLAVGLVVLFFRLRLRNPAVEKARRKQQLDPLKQTVTGEEPETDTQPGRPSSPGKSPARLVYLSGAEGDLSPNSAFNLPAHNTVIGSDAVRCDITLAGPTISPVHAEVYQDPLKNWLIADRGSAAGTWINYAPVSSQGSRLENGDMIHIGICTFRFELANAKQRTIQVQPYQE